MARCWPWAAHAKCSRTPASSRPTWAAPTRPATLQARCAARRPAPAQGRSHECRTAARRRSSRSRRRRCSILRRTAARRRSHRSRRRRCSSDRRPAARRRSHRSRRRRYSSDRRPAARRRSHPSRRRRGSSERRPVTTTIAAPTTALNPMLAYSAKRLLLMLPTLLGVLLVTFVVIQFVPGGAVEQYLVEARMATAGKGGAAQSDGLSYRGNQGVDPKRLAQIKALYGFDKPAHERFLQMLGQFARFDLGQSFFQNKSVWSLVKEKLPVSISLGLWTFFISYLVAVPLGVAKAVRA